MRFIVLPSQDELQVLLAYCNETGEFTWKAWPENDDYRTRIRNKKYAGRPAGRRTASGYHCIKLGGVQFQAHRIAWAYAYGTIPTDCEIDHINGNRSDNRLANLRLATRAENATNRKLSTRNTSGVRGVACKDGFWRARIRARGEFHDLGRFETKEEATAAYLTASQKLHGQFAAHLSRAA